MKIKNQDGNAATPLLNSYSISSLVPIFQTICHDTPLRDGFLTNRESITQNQDWSLLVGNAKGT